MAQRLRAFAYCSCRGRGFNSQCPNGVSQPPTAAVLGNSVSHSDFCKHQASTWHTHIYVAKHSHTQNKSKQQQKPWKLAGGGDAHL